MTNSPGSCILAKSICTTIRPEFRAYLFLLYAHDQSTKIYGPLSFNLSFCARPFVQKSGSTLIYFFYLHTTIRQEYMVLFYLFFLLYTTIRQKYMVFFHLFFLLCTTIRPKNKVRTDLFLYMYTTIRPKIRVHIDLFFLFAHDHSTKL